MEYINNQIIKKYIKKNNSLKGFNALLNNESNNNSAFGFSCMKSNKKGYQNTSLGSFSMIKNESGINNTSIGFRSLNNVNGDSNTALGSFSGNNLENGKLNILIGRNSQTSNNNSYNEIVIGSYAEGHNNNTIVLGNNKIKSIEPGSDSKVNLGSKLYNFNNLYYSGNLVKNNNIINDFLEEENINVISNGNFYKKTVLNINNSTEDKYIDLISDLTGSIFLCNICTNNIIINLPSLLNKNNIGITYTFLLIDVEPNKYLEINTTTHFILDKKSEYSDADSDADSDAKSNLDKIEENVNKELLVEDIKQININELLLYNKFEFITIDKNKIIFHDNTPKHTHITITSIKIDNLNLVETWLIDIKTI